MPRPHSSAPAAPPAALPAMETPCAKCGAVDPLRRWIGAGRQRSGQGLDLLAVHSDFGPWPAGEFQLSTCQACGFIWAAACLAQLREDAPHD